MSSLPAVKIPCNRIAAGSSLALSSLILLDILVDIPGLLGKNEHRRVLLGWIGNSLMLALVGVGVLASLWALSRPMLVIDDDGIHDRTALFNAMGFIPWERTAGFAVAYGATGRAWGAESALPKKYRGRGVVRIIWSEEGAPSRPVGRLPRLLGRRGPKPLSGVVNNKATSMSGEQLALLLLAQRRARRPELPEAPGIPATPPLT